MGLDVGEFSSPRPYPCRPRRAYRIRLYMRPEASLRLSMVARGAGFRGGTLHRPKYR